MRKMNKDLKSYFLQQLKKIIEDFNKYNQIGPLNDRSASSIITRVKASVERIAGRNSVYYKRIEEIMEQFQNWRDVHFDKINSIIGQADALLHDLEADYLKSLTELIHDELFFDFLEMAEFLLAEGFKDPSAVLAGSTLEEHLRKLCEKHNINTQIISEGKKKPKKASQLNNDIYQKKITKKGELKQIIAWLDIRNNAAHGNYNEYNKNDVDLMIKGMRIFISKNPA